MAFRLSPRIQERIAALREAEYSAKATFAQLDDADLALSAEFWMQHCEAPKRIEPGEPTYDSTFWYAILPELLTRLRRREKRTKDGGEDVG